MEKREKEVKKLWFCRVNFHLTFCSTMLYCRWFNLGLYSFGKVLKSFKTIQKKKTKKKVTLHSQCGHSNISITSLFYEPRPFYVYKCSRSTWNHPNLDCFLVFQLNLKRNSIKDLLNYAQSQLAVKKKEEFKDKFKAQCVRFSTI